MSLVSSLEQALEASQGEVLGLTEALAQRDGLVSELRAQAEVHTAQLRQLQKLKVELSSSKEMNEVSPTTELHRWGEWVGGWVGG